MSSHPFAMSIHSDGSLTRVYVSGDIDATHASLLEKICTNLVGPARRLELHLAGVEYFGVAATELIVGLRHRASESGGVLGLVDVPDPVANLLDLVERAGVTTGSDVDERSRPQLNPDEFNEIVAKAGLTGREGLCVTNADLAAPGPSILVVNGSFTSITGYLADDVLGLNPRILQGELTDRATLDRLRANLEAGERFEGETVNYRKDGSPFVMNWTVVPVRSTSGRTFHVAQQHDGTEMRRLRRFERATGYINGKHDSIAADDPSDRQRVVADALAAALMILVEDGTAEVLLGPDGVEAEANSALADNDRVAVDAEAGTVWARFAPTSATAGVVRLHGAHPDRIRLTSPGLVEALVDHAVAVIQRADSPPLL